LVISFSFLKAECLRKSILLEENVAKANSEKQALLEQKEIVVQQLQRENEVLEVSCSAFFKQLLTHSCI